MPKIAIYPGSFDPVTNGHIDIIERGLKLFDKVIVTILYNPKKEYLFSLEERLEMLGDAILRGLRAMSDFEYEFQMALMNRRLNRDVQTVFLMTGFRWIYTSSSIIKEAVQFGGNIEGMVPPLVKKKLKAKFAPAAERGASRKN